jgi:hypothetical protein
VCIFLTICHVCNALLTCIPGLSEPLPQDAALFRDVDIITNDVRRCYDDMDKFWVDEVQRANNALRNRRVDPEDIARWKMFRESLEDAIAKREAWLSSARDFLRSHL